MATVTYKGEAYSCSKAIKGADYIHLLDSVGVMIASFDGIRDFSAFSISGATWAAPRPENECYVAVIRDDGSVGEGGHKCSEIADKVSKHGDTIDGSMTVTGDMNIGGSLTVGGKVFNPYAIGCVYISSNATSPAEIYGGTWEQIKDVFLLAAGGKYAAGSTGGEEMHQLTVDEMPSHWHDNARRAEPDYEDNASTGESTGSADSSHCTDEAGGDEPHNNMPPYKAYYMWERVA